MKKVYFRIRNIFLICFMLSALASCSQMEHAGIHTGFSVTMPKAEGLKSARYTRNDVTYYKLFVYQMHTEDIFVDDIAHLMNDVTAFENAVNHLADRLTPFTEDVKLFPGQTYTSPELVPGDYMVFVSAYKSDSDIPIGQGGDIATVVAGKVTSVTIRINLENAVEENVTINVKLTPEEEGKSLSDYTGFSGTLTLSGISKKAGDFMILLEEYDREGKDISELIKERILNGEDYSDLVNGFDLSDSYKMQDYEKILDVEITERNIVCKSLDTENPKIFTLDITNPIISFTDCFPGYYWAYIVLSNGEKSIDASYPAYLADENLYDGKYDSGYAEGGLVFEEGDGTSGDDGPSEDGVIVSEEENENGDIPEEEMDSYGLHLADALQAFEANKTYTMELTLPSLADPLYPVNVEVVTDNILVLEEEEALYLNDEDIEVKLRGYDNDSNLTYTWFLNENNINDYLSQKPSEDVSNTDAAYFSLNVQDLMSNPALVVGENEIKVYIYDGDNKPIGSAIAKFEFKSEYRIRG